LVYSHGRLSTSNASKGRRIEGRSCRCVLVSVQKSRHQRLYILRCSLLLLGLGFQKGALRSPSGGPDHAVKGTHPRDSLRVAPPLKRRGESESISQTQDLITLRQRAVDQPSADTQGSSIRQLTTGIGCRCHGRIFPSCGRPFSSRARFDPGVRNEVKRRGYEWTRLEPEPAPRTLWPLC
jgi:hypothetical protein